MSPTFRIILVYGVLIGVVLSMLRVLELLYLTGRLNLDIYIGVVALVFLLGGVHVGSTWRRTRVFRASARADFETNGLSQRELQVLEHIADGASNREIANRLYVSTNTVKTHINHLYAKIGVNRRTQRVISFRRPGLPENAIGPSSILPPASALSCAFRYHETRVGPSPQQETIEERFDIEVLGFDCLLDAAAIFVAGAQRSGEHRAVA